MGLHVFSPHSAAKLIDGEAIMEGGVRIIPAEAEGELIDFMEGDGVRKRLLVPPS
jgi:hypothetical protein